MHCPSRNLNQLRRPETTHHTCCLPAFCWKQDIPHQICAWLFPGSALGGLVWGMAKDKSLEKSSLRGTSSM